MTIGIPTANGIQFLFTTQRTMETISMELIIIPMPSMNRWTVLNFFCPFRICSMSWIDWKEIVRDWRIFCCTNFIVWIWFCFSSISNFSCFNCSSRMDRIISFESACSKICLIASKFRPRVLRRQIKDSFFTSASV